MNEPITAAGKRLLAVMSTVPLQGRMGLAWFIDAIETEARNLGYADRLDEHINGLCGTPTLDMDRARIRAAIAALYVGPNPGYSREPDQSEVLAAIEDEPC